MNRRRIVIIGATSAIAEHCARLWLTDSPADLVLIGRNLEKTERVAADLRVRSNDSGIRTATCDFYSPSEIGKLASQIAAAGDIDIVLIAHGDLSDQEFLQTNIVEVKKALETNAVSPVLFAEAFAQNMQNKSRGTIAIIGSVAGDRGRKSNYVYGSAKGLVTRYAEGMQHRFAGSALKVVLIKPGPTDTPMVSHLKQEGAKLAKVEVVAQDIVKGVEKGKAVVYTPRIWWIVMFVVRHLPGNIFRRLNI